MCTAEAEPKRQCNQRAECSAEGPFVAPLSRSLPLLAGWLLTAYGSKFAFSILAHLGWLCRREGGRADSGEIVRSFVRPTGGEATYLLKRVNRAEERTLTTPTRLGPSSSEGKNKPIVSGEMDETT